MTTCFLLGEEDKHCNYAPLEQGGFPRKLCDKNLDQAHLNSSRHTTRFEYHAHYGFSQEATLPRPRKTSDKKEKERQDREPQQVPSIGVQMWKRTKMEHQLLHKYITDEEFKKVYLEGPRVKKSQGQAYETDEFIYLCELVTHPAFNKTVGLITDFNAKYGAYRVTLIGKAKNYHLEHAKLKNMMLIQDSETWQKLYEEAPMIRHDISIWFLVQGS